jgi:hypothetical protein
MAQRELIEYLYEATENGRGAAPAAGLSSGAMECHVIGVVRFVGSLLPLFDRCSWREVTAFHAISRALDLGGNTRLRAALVGVFLTAGDSQRALGWWSYVLAQALDFPDVSH